MCELFGLTGPDEIAVNEYLKSFAGHSTAHPNGWGIAVFNQNEVNIEKEPEAAYRSHYLKARLRSPVRARNMMAHIRFATRGQIEYENCHPFLRRDQSGRSWTFMHNGTIFDCPLLDKYIHSQCGQTDSERILLYLIDQVNAETAKKRRALTDNERFTVIDRAVQDITAHNKVNFLLYDGSLFYVHENLKDSLFIRRLGRSLLFATAPLDSKKWEPVELCRLRAYRDCTCVLTGTPHHNEYINNPEDMRLLFLDYALL
jgi:glutamine amidotransferase